MNGKIISKKTKTKKNQTRPPKKKNKRLKTIWELSDMHVRVHVYAWWVVYRLLLCGNPFGVPFSLREKKTFQHNA